MRITLQGAAAARQLVSAVACWVACQLGTGLAWAAVPAHPSRGCAADRIERGSSLNGSIDVGGLPRAYILDVPASVQPRVPAPLVFDFHGFGDSARGAWRASKFREPSARDGVITVYPDGLPVHLLGRDAPGWQIASVEGNRDLAFTAALLEHLARAYCIDEARVFATGFSNGGFFSHLLGCTMADRFAAVAPVGGGLLTSCTPSRVVSVLIHHGRNDQVVPVQDARKARGAWLAIDQCRQHASNDCEWHRQCRNGAEVVYCEDDGTHHWPVQASERIWEFFRDHPMRDSAQVRE